MSAKLNPFTGRLQLGGGSGGGGGGGITTIAGNSGTATGATVNLETANTNVPFTATGDTVTLDFFNAQGNILLGNSGASLAGGTANVSLGRDALSSVTTGTGNIGVNFAALGDVTTGANNIAIGVNCLRELETGSDNIGIGTFSLNTATGSSNTSIGNSSLDSLVDGSGNVAIGQAAGSNYEGSESNNICISNDGVLGESDAIRIGRSSPASPAHTSAYLGGVYNSTVAESAVVGVAANGRLSNLGFGTSGQVLTSNGAGASPTWQAAGSSGTVTSTSVVSANGFSGSVANPTTTPAITMSTTVGTNQPIYSSGGALSGAGVGSNGQVFTSNGGGSPPSWQNLPSTSISQVVLRVFTSSGSYVPTSGMKYCIAEGVGGGGGGGSTVATGAALVSAGGGGGGGGYFRSRFTAAQIGAAQTVNIGAGGAGATPANTQGTAGGTTSLGVLASAGGGIGGSRGGASVVSVGDGGQSASTLNGDFTARGNAGGIGMCFYVGTTSAGAGGNGGDSLLGGGGNALGGSVGAAGSNATAPGGGGSGAYSMPSGTGYNGGNGADGIVIITEYI